MSRKGDIKVGAFVLAGIVLGVLVIFLIGGERRLFDSKVQYDASFDDVQGLKPGAPVTMGGVRVGDVRSVRYEEEATDNKVHVVLNIAEIEAARILSDSKAQIVPKGLLGDKEVRITKGEKGDKLPPGGTLEGEEPSDMLSRMDEMAGKAGDAIDDVGVVAKRLSDEQLHKDIRQTAHSMSVLLKQITEGEGYPNRFLNDPAEAERISRTIDALDQTAKELTLTLREVRHSATQIRTGPGFAHDVIYGDGPQKELAQLGGAADEVALTLKGIREGDGFAHDMLFGGDGQAGDALKNVTQMTADLRDIVRDVKNGKGTVGALLVDPSIYEDVKRLLGNVERNSVLRALVRYSIKKGEHKPKVDLSAAKE